jgi:Lon-like ATP-dependent protease
LKRKSTARGSVENVVAALSRHMKQDCSRAHVRFNIPGGIPVDGPSAGVAMAIALYSALTNRAADHLLAATGEITISGDVRPVGGVREKLEAAAAAGATRVIIPVANWEDDFADIGVEVLPVEQLAEVVRIAFDEETAALGDTVVPLPSAQEAAFATARKEQAAAKPQEIASALKCERNSAVPLP